MTANNCIFGDKDVEVDPKFCITLLLYLVVWKLEYYIISYFRFEVFPQLSSEPKLPFPSQCFFSYFLLTKN